MNSSWKNRWPVFFFLIRIISQVHWNLIYLYCCYHHGQAVLELSRDSWGHSVLQTPALVVTGSCVFLSKYTAICPSTHSRPVCLGRKKSSIFINNKFIWGKGKSACPRQDTNPRLHNTMCSMDRTTQTVLFKPCILIQATTLLFLITF